MGLARSASVLVRAERGDRRCRSLLKSRKVLFYPWPYPEVFLPLAPRRRPDSLSFVVLPCPRRSVAPTMPAPSTIATMRTLYFPFLYYVCVASEQTPWSSSRPRRPQIAGVAPQVLCTTLATQRREIHVNTQPSEWTRLRPCHRPPESWSGLLAPPSREGPARLGKLIHCHGSASLWALSTPRPVIAVELRTLLSNVSQSLFRETVSGKYQLMSYRISKQQLRGLLRSRLGV